ncbi:UTRA domain-containing protein [Enterobacter sp. RVSM5a]|nr:UTRA domain-containing protein [Enterobacter sp. RVSM5a]
MHGGKPYTGIKPYAREKTEMEQAHTRLIAQLKERIAAPDNTPLYLKFAETVKNAVRSGVLAHGNILPGERDLSQLAGVSRITVRKAMQALEEAGVVTRARGYGTQINNIFEYSLKEARGFSQQVVLRGKTPNTLWVNKRVVKCPEEIARHLSLAPDSDVFLLKRIRYVDDDAVSIEESWVPVGLIPNPDDIGVSLYDYFRSQNIFPQRTRSRVSARMPDSEFQAHIKMDDKIPVLVIKQVALDQQHRPIEYSISYCRSDYTSLCARSRASRVGAQSPPRWLTTQAATALPSCTASGSDHPAASPARVPPAWLSPAPMVSTTVAGNAGTCPEASPSYQTAPSLSWRTISAAPNLCCHRVPSSSTFTPSHSAASSAS